MRPAEWLGVRKRNVGDPACGIAGTTGDSAVANKRSKRYREAAKLVDGERQYPLAEAVKVLKSMPQGKTNQTLALAFKLSVDPKQSDQAVRGTVNLPHGSGKNVRVLVFAKGKAASDATAAGADIVG